MGYEGSGCKNLTWSKLTEPDITERKLYCVQFFFSSFLLKKKKKKKSLWQLQREGWEGQEGKWETGQPAAVVWVRVDGSGLVVAHGLDLW